MTSNLPTFLKRQAHALIRTAGFDIVKSSPRVSDFPPDFPPDFSPDHISIINAVKKYTMTSPERLFALIEAVHHITRCQIPGNIVECGVWKGGSMMAVALTLRQLGVRDRDLDLFDTFEGMPEPQELDVDLYAKPAKRIFAERIAADPAFDFGRVCLPVVEEAMNSCGYEAPKIHFHQGKVEDTIPSEAPETIALLRLDTDWYESTRHELEHLYPQLSPGGILIIDDYGHWRGARKAVDEYIEKHAPSLFLSRIDYTGRIAVKPQFTMR